MPPKKSSGPPKASVVQQDPPDGISVQLWELSKSTSHLVEKLNVQETEEDIQQGCSKAEVARLLWHEASQKTNAGQQRRKEALEYGILDKALQGVQSYDASLVEPCAGLLYALLREAPESLEMLLAAPSDGVLTLWKLIGTGGHPVQTSAAGCLEVLIQAEQTKSRVLKLIQGAEWQVVAKALGQLVPPDAGSNRDSPSLPAVIKDTFSAVLQLMAAILFLEGGQQAVSPGAARSSQAQQMPARAAQPTTKPAGRGKPAPNAGSTESSRQVLLERASQSDIPSQLLQICQDRAIEVKSREAAVRLVHALLTGRLWPLHHPCLAGTACAGLVSVLSAGDMSHASKALAAATLKDFLLPALPDEAMPAIVPSAGPEAASSKTRQAKAQDRPQALLHAQVLPEAALHQAMDRISDVLSTGAVPILTALAVGFPESKAAKASNDAAALQLEAISCLRTVSLSDTCKSLMTETGQARMLLPLLTSKNDALRWMSRQVLLNVATSEQAAEALERDGAPAYVHGMNIVHARRTCGQAERTSPQLHVLQLQLYMQYSQA